MIKSLPGWANFILLWVGYLVFTLVVDWIFHAGIVHWKYDMLITSIYCGAYLAKWRFYDGGWHFN